MNINSNIKGSSPKRINSKLIEIKTQEDQDDGDDQIERNRSGTGIQMRGENSTQTDMSRFKDSIDSTTLDW